MSKKIIIALVIAAVVLTAGIMLINYFQKPPASHEGHERKALFYRNPMNPNITSPSPRKDEMGMDYVPVYEDEVSQEGGVKISPEQEKMLGVETDKVIVRPLYKEVRTVGVVANDPELYVAQEEYISALQLKDEDLIAASKKRLRLLGLSDKQIAQFKADDQPQGNLILPGETAWVNLTVYESEMGLVKIGASVVLETVAYPGETFSGKITSISPALDPMTRSVKARVEVKNPDSKLKPDMYMSALIKIGLGIKLSVSEDAVIQTGKRTLAVVKKGDGEYASQEIVVGQKAEGYYAVLQGLKDGDEVVTDGNFLIDSESKLKSAAPTEHQH